MDKLTALLIIASEGVGFGALALMLGYDTIVIGAIMGLLGTIAGYVVGKAT